MSMRRMFEVGSTVVVGVIAVIIFNTLANDKRDSFDPNLVNIAILAAAWGIASFYYYLIPKQSRRELEGYSLMQSSDDEGLQLSSAASTQLSVNDINWSNSLNFMLNGTPISLLNPDPAELLASFIRDKVGLKGTKLGCEEGGCGACSVILTTAKSGVISINSCLRPLCAMDGQALNTIESIGSVSSGLSDEQQQIVKNNGTQCGFCTPGWVANIHALNEAAAANGEVPTGRQIENYLDGNMCRCTGYRPIIKAFKEFSTDADGDVPCHVKAGFECAGVCASVNNCKGGTCSLDLEALCASTAVEKPAGKCSDRKKSVPLGRKRDEAFVKEYVPQPLMFYNSVTKKRWIRPVGIEQLCAVIRAYGQTETIQFMGGNTGQGINKYLNDTAPYNTPDNYSIIIDINAIPIFSMENFNSLTRELTVGAGVTLNQLIHLLQTNSKTLNAASVPATPALHVESVDPASLFSVCAHHLSFIAGTQVRNAGSWAGNLMTFLRHKSFPSDCVLALTTVGATLQVMDGSANIFAVTMEDFIKMSYDEFMSKGWVILSATLSDSKTISLGYRTVAKTFRIAQRARNSHAHVNAGFHFVVSGTGDRNQGPVICTSARIVFGGVSQRTFVAMRTEQSLLNMPLTYATLQSALNLLAVDLAEVGASTYWGDQDFRESVMQTYLYRMFLHCYPLSSLPSNLKSAVLPWIKPESRGIEVFTPSGTGNNSDVKEGPVGKAVKKLEAPLQTTGEAMYPSDVVLPAQGLHAALVFSTQCAVTLLGFDTSAAQRVPGFVSFITAADIPGTNSVSDGITLFVELNALVQCVGAPIGVVVATSEAAANECASAIVVNYSSRVSIPITNVDQAIQQESFFPIHIPGITVVSQGNPKQAMENSPRRVKGHVSASGQSHFYMETQTAVSTPVDGDCFEIVCGTQDPAGNLSFIASILNLPQNKVTVTCPRVGGAFGGKITRGITVAAASALAAKILKRPVRIFNTRTADMAMVGGRESFAVDYEIGFSNDGTINAVSCDYYIDGGIASADAFGGLYMGMHWADNAYFLPNYIANAKLCYTNTPARTSMRAPGVVQSCLATEALIERVAVECGLSVDVVQKKNFTYNGATTITGQTIEDCRISRVWDTMLEKSKYQERLSKVDYFNSTNLWRKRGIAICPVKYGIGWNGYNAGVRIGVRSVDGTVIVTHSGCEIGQGINTKMAQAVAYQLGIDLSLIRVTSTSTEKISNGGVTGGSGTSEVIVQAALNAANNLNSRLDPYRTKSTFSRVSASAPAEMTNDEWIALLQSLPCDVSLNVEGWYSPTTNPNGQEFQYFVYGAAVTEIELDVLSGDVMVLAGEIVYDCGQSLNPAVDIGQIEGGFVMTLGYFLTEHVLFDSNGNLLTNGSFEYKLPQVKEIPALFNVTLLDNDYNTAGILGSKATAEPCMVVGNSIYFAVKMAIASARVDAGHTEYFPLNVPSIVDVRQRASLVNANRFVMPF